MKRLIITLFLTISVALGSFGIGWSGDPKKGFDAAKKGDYVTAFLELYPIALKGHPNAQYAIGEMFNRGQGTPKDFKMAVKFFTLSAEQGHQFAQFQLGLNYALGKGVIQDDIYAHMWANIANSNGAEKGKELIKILLEDGMTRSEVDKATDLARDCVKKNYKGC